MIGIRDLLHRLVGRLARRETLGDVALDVLDDHDRVVDHDADGEHQPEQAERIDGKTEEVEERERADDRHRHRHQRNDRGAPGLQEQDDDEHDERGRLQQGSDDRLDGGAHELGGVVDDLVVHALGHGPLDLRHGGAHVVGDLDRVRAGRGEHADRHGGLVVEQRAQRVFGRAELDARDVAQPRDGAAVALEDDFAELLLALQAALRVDRELQIDAVRHPAMRRRCPPRPGRSRRESRARCRPRTGCARRPCSDRARRAWRSRRCPTSAPGPRLRCAPGDPLR